MLIDPLNLDVCCDNVYNSTVNSEIFPSILFRE